jgi:HEPN domain-containing protein
MSDPRDHAETLLKKAANDLVAARATLGTGKALDMVCFHTQQVAEKSLKAVLALHDIEYPWCHDLAELLALAKPLVPDLDVLEEAIVRLSPFAVEIRYDAEFEPSLDEARDALKTAQQVYDHVLEIVQHGRNE